AHVVAHADDYSRHFLSPSMTDDGTIFALNADTLYAFGQAGNVVNMFDPPNPGEGEFLGGLSEAEVTRDGQYVLARSTWSDCNGGGISDICNATSIVPADGTPADLGYVVLHDNTTWW